MTTEEKADLIQATKELVDHMSRIRERANSEAPVTLNIVTGCLGERREIDWWLSQIDKDLFSAEMSLRVLIEKLEAISDEPHED